MRACEREAATENEERESRIRRSTCRRETSPAVVARAKLLNPRDPAREEISGISLALCVVRCALCVVRCALCAGVNDIELERKPDSEGQSLARQSSGAVIEHQMPTVDHRGAAAGSRPDSQD